MTEVSILGKTKPVLNIFCSDGSSFYNDNDNNKNDNNTGFSMNILCVDNKSPVQRDFYKNGTMDLLPALRFLGSLYNFCNFVIIFSLIKSRRYVQVVTCFTDLEMIKYFQKTYGRNRSL